MLALGLKKTSKILVVRKYPDKPRTIPTQADNSKELPLILLIASQFSSPKLLAIRAMVPADTRVDITKTTPEMEFAIPEEADCSRPS